MPKSQKKATMAIKTKTKSKGHTTKQGPKTSQTVHSALCHKRKPKDSSTDSEESSDPEPKHLPHRKRAKQSVDDEVEMVDDEPEVVLDLASSSDRDDTRSSDEEV